LRFSQSRDGRYVAWQRGECASAVRLAQPGSDQPPARIAFPARYGHHDLEALAVAADGRVTALLDRNKCYRGPGIHVINSGLKAIVTAEPGAPRFSVVATSRNRLADWPISPDGRTFAGCLPLSSLAGRNGQRGEVIAVRTEPTFAVHRTTVKYARVSSRFVGPYCAASDAGTATMSVRQATRDGEAFTALFATVGLSQGPLRATGPDALFDGITGLTPDGRRALLHTKLRGSMPFVSLVDVARGRVDRRFELPRSVLGGPHGPIAQEGFPGSVLSWDPAGGTAVGTYFRRGDEENVRDLFLFHLSSGVATMPLRGLPPESAAGLLRPCYLPSGRILIADSRRAGMALLLSNVSRTRFRPLSATRLGSVLDVLCDPMRPGTVLFAANRSEDTITDVWSVEASAIDGSPLQPAP
jgi:hypothetical protein